MVYNIGQWTKSTFETLIFIKERSDTGKNPKMHNFPSGTYRNWVYVLNKNGYLINEDGYKLTEKGIQLLQQLKDNPPADRRGRRRIIEQAEEESQPRKRRKVNTKPTMYRVTVAGHDLAFDSLVTHDKAVDIIQKISEVIKKQ